jgi:hypothetical protein
MREQLAVVSGQGAWSRDHREGPGHPCRRPPGLASRPGRGVGPQDARVPLIRVDGCRQPPGSGDAPPGVCRRASAGSGGGPWLDAGPGLRWSSARIMCTTRGIPMMAQSPTKPKNHQSPMGTSRYRTGKPEIRFRSMSARWQTSKTTTSCCTLLPVTKPRGLRRTLEGRFEGPLWTPGRSAQGGGWVLWCRAP